MGPQVLPGPCFPLGHSLPQAPTWPLCHGLFLTEITTVAHPPPTKPLPPKANLKYSFIEMHTIYKVFLLYAQLQFPTESVKTGLFDFQGVYVQSDHVIY